MPPGPAVMAYLDKVAGLVGDGTVLELGSGPGWDASYLENRGPRVLRTDGAPAFVQMLQAAGHQAQLLDVGVDDFGGPYDAVLADAVLLHVSREQFVDVLQRARQAVTSGGVLAITLKEGDGEAWTDAKLGRPRHFTYWREPAVGRTDRHRLASPLAAACRRARRAQAVRHSPDRTGAEQDSPASHLSIGH